jgi:hypothetical protein
MLRLGIVSSLISCSLLAIAQTTPQATPSDPFAISLAQKSIAALSGGVPIIDVTLNTKVISVLGADNDSGTGAFQAKGIGESRVDLTLSSGTRSDVRSMAGTTPAGAWKENGAPARSYALHNCWTDSAWFFPAFSSLIQMGNLNSVFKYIGQEQHNGLNTQHIEVYQQGQFQALTTIDLFLDPTSYLPFAIAYNQHPDNDMNKNIPVEILFANYQSVGGVQVPFHFQRMYNGLVILDVTVTSVAFNTGLSDSVFTLQ